MLIGKDYIRLDGREKVTGAARYVDDLHPEGCLYGVTLRSPHAHARLMGITPDPDFDWSEITLVTAQEIPGENLIALMTDDQPALADELVRHVAEPVALLAAATRALALEAAEHLRVEYEPLPALLDFEEAEGNSILIFGEDNLFSRLLLEKGDVDARFAEAPLLIEGSYRTGQQEQLYIEPQGLIAIPGEDGILSIIGSMQCPYYIHKALLRVLGHDRFHVRQSTTGGAFGGKEEYPSILAAHVALLALKSGRPVKMVYERQEDLLATPKRHPARVEIRTSVDPESGRLLALESHILFDGGAYNTLSPVVNSRGVLHATGPYFCPDIRVEGLMVATNTPPKGAFRGFGAPQVQFAMERHMDRIARLLKIDPAELRAINHLRPGQETATEQLLLDSAAGEVLKRARAWMQESPPAPVGQPKPGCQGARLARGRGLALGFHGAGFTGNGEAGLAAKVDLALLGQRLEIYSASVDIGQGTDTIFPAIVAETLALPLSSVSCAPNDTATVPNSGPTAASRTVMAVGSVVRRAALKLREALRKELDAPPETSFREMLASRCSEAPLRVRAQYEDQGAVWDPLRLKGDAYPTYAWTAVVVELDVDLDTGEVHHRRLYHSTDVGKALNRQMVSGQLEGGVLQALGWATFEEVVLDKRGAMLNAQLADYIIPTSLDAPEMITDLVEVPFAGGPFGAKGIGELPHDIPAAAVAQAIEAATGAVLDQLPMTPEQILEALS